MGRAWGQLLQRQDFLRTAGSGMRRGTPAFLLQAVAQETTGRLRVGFTASRKVGNAVARNRAKRRLRAVADLVLSPFVAKPIDLVLVARQDVLTRDFAAMTADLTKTATQLLSDIENPRPVRFAKKEAP